MKKYLVYIILLWLNLTINAQVAESSWSLGFGLTYPRYQSTDLRPLESNYGGYLSLQKSFSENVALRLSGFLYSIDGRVPGGTYFYDNGTPVPSGTEEVTNTLIGADLDALYYISPCHKVSPYLLLGFGAVSYEPDWRNITNAQAVSKVTMEISLGAGIEWYLSDNLNFKTEFTYVSIDGQVDGIVNNNRQGMLGSNADAYIAF